MSLVRIRLTVRQNGVLSKLSLINPVPAEAKLFVEGLATRTYLGAIRITRGDDETVLTVITTVDNAVEAFDNLVGERVADWRKRGQGEAQDNAQTHDRPYEHEFDLLDVDPLALQLYIVTTLTMEANCKPPANSV